jgi:hypothetical protein
MGLAVPPAFTRNNARSEESPMSNLEARVEELSRENTRHYVHEDGSHSFIVQQEFDTEIANPRDDDGNVSTLIMEHRDYLPLDDDDAGLAEARERWDFIENHGHYGYRNAEVSSWHNVGQAAMIRAGYDREKVMRRYLAMFRPEILHYEDRWEVSGYSQGDWAHGWGYVTRESWEKWMGADYTGDVTPEQAFKQEIKVYQQYFRGDVYGCIHLEQGDPIVIYGDHGAYVDDHEVKEDAVWGFLCYDDLKEITADFTDSPITEEI